MMAWNDGYQVWLSESKSMENAQMVINHFVGTDWTKESISALCGNMRHESSINPDMYEYGYSWGSDRGYGLVQWTPRSKYWDWAVARNLPPREGDSQLARIDYEVENNIQWIPRSDYGNMTFTQFRRNSGNWSVAYLTEAFTWSYERPNRQAGENSMPGRKSFAQRVFNELDFSGTGEGGSEDCIQLAQFPMDVLYITQGENGGFSHQGELAIDFVGWNPSSGQITQYPYYAPCDCECIGRLDSAAILYWISQKPVMCADGQVRSIMWRCIHDDILDYTVGDKLKKGEHMGNSGNGGQSSGDHFHLDVWKGETNNPFARVDPLHIYDVFAINNVEVYQDLGYPWRVSDYQDCSNTGGGDGGTPTIDKKIGLTHLLMCDALNGWKL